MQIDGVTSDYFAVSSIDQGALGKEAFLELLVTQLRNQDPLNPMENTEFLAQLSQFSSLEQLFNVNEALNRNADLTLSVHNTLMSQLIGKDVKLEGDIIRWQQGDGTEIAYDVASGGEVTVQLLNTHGEVVRSISMGEQSIGEYRVAWDGLDDNGNVALPGEYQVRILHAAADGQQSVLNSYLIGRVTSVRFVDGNPILYIGNQSVNPSDIIAIYDSSVSGNE